MKIYIINEVYDTDGAYGYSETHRIPMYATENKELAKAYVDKYNKPVVRHGLSRHGLEIRRMELKDPDINIDPWDCDDEDDDEEDY